MGTHCAVILGPGELRHRAGVSRRVAWDHPGGSGCEGNEPRQSVAYQILHGTRCGASDTRDRHLTLFANCFNIVKPKVFAQFPIADAYPPWAFGIPLGGGWPTQLAPVF